jgi:hypothetical protein
MDRKCLPTLNTQPRLVAALLGLHLTSNPGLRSLVSDYSALPFKEGILNRSTSYAWVKEPKTYTWSRLRQDLGECVAWTQHLYWCVARSCHVSFPRYAPLNYSVRAPI